MLGNQLIDFIKGNSPKSENDWFLNLSTEEQKKTKKAIKDYNNILKLQGSSIDINRWSQFADVSDDVKTYLKSLNGAKASTEGL